MCLGRKKEVCLRLLMEKGVIRVAGKRIAVIIKDGVGDTKKSVILKRGATVEEALEAGGNTIKDGSEVRLNGDTTSMSEEVEDGDIITIFSKISGA